MSALQDGGYDDEFVEEGHGFGVEFEFDDFVGITKDGDVGGGVVFEDLFDFE